MTLEKRGQTLVAGSGSNQAVHALANRGKERLAELDADVWRLARQLRGEWRRERYAYLKPLRRNEERPCVELLLK